MNSFCYSCVLRTTESIDTNVRARLSFAQDYSRWTEDAWSRVLFSDETHFYLGHHGREYVQHPPGKALDPKYTRKDNKRLEDKVSLWGCMSALVDWATLNCTLIPWTLNPTRPFQASISSPLLSNSGL
jgi:hypothetical protein